jgi:hypothetical protein
MNIHYMSITTFTFTLNSNILRNDVRWASQYCLHQRRRQIWHSVRSFTESKKAELR